MITIFSTPKNFNGKFKTIQLNAIRSWRNLSSDIQIIILGNSKGCKEMANEINADYIPNVKCSPQGTPLLSDLFFQAKKNANYNTLTFINADIILPNNFLSSIKIVKNKLKKYLIIGHRWDIDIDKVINYNDLDEYNKIIKEINSDSIMHSPSGIDYFIFNKDLWKKIPDFIIGRPGYDNWLIWSIRRRLLPVIDASHDIKVIHQNHSYTFHHIKNNTDARKGREATKNIELHKGKGLNILDSTYRLLNSNLEKNNDMDFKIRNLHRLPTIFPEISFLIKVYRRLYKIFIKYGSK